MRDEANGYYDRDSVEHFRHWHDFAEKNLFGIEINDEIARVAKMNMIIHDDGHTNVIGEDALERLNQMENRSGNHSFKAGAFDLVLTNPPFGAIVKKDERPYLVPLQGRIEASRFLGVSHACQKVSCASH